ncbi:MAG: SUMF1/EgtB/PvdO family nonheme iron enzyme [Bacteroidia bacterium]|nr:SUMF1/EgtB/PvdO family nonheme iron enzyme [Bacteroidia bacterium]
MNHTLRETLPNGTTFEMILVEGGRFWRGENEARHEVQLSDFYLGRMQVTQALWQAVTGTHPAAFPHPQRPVEQVSWYDCIEFCNALSEIQGYAPVYQINRERKHHPSNTSKYDKIKWLVTILPRADGYRLPTEAEWEYAARGGCYAQSFEYAGSPNENEAAWWHQTSQEISQPVGLKVPNALGLFDMSGNIREWVWDWYDGAYYQRLGKHPEPAPTPVGADYGSDRGVRGGSWLNRDASFCCVAYRNLGTPDFRLNSVGGRLCRYLAR